jgi:catechol-2,3-dioxygenase
VLISEVRLPASNLTAQLDFYQHRLGLGVQQLESAGEIVVTVGSTRLIFEQATVDWQGIYHFAINIPENQFSAAKGWLQQRAELLRDQEKRDEFDFQDWNAHSVYCHDPAGNILELIAHHSLSNASTEPFGPAQLLAVCEIGLAVENVPETVAKLETQCGLAAYHDERHDQFTAVGDANGLLIVVKEGRLWIPERQRPAWIQPMLVKFQQGSRVFEIFEPGTKFNAT